jgi:LysR family cyn operon transcriptional activator
MGDATLMLRPLRYVLTLAEVKNFTRAAEMLHVSQPALSQQIRQIERELGSAIFDRGGRVVSLTEFGRVYIDHAQKALEHLEAGRRAVHDVRDLAGGLLRLAYTPTFAEYLIAPALQHFQNAYPSIAIDASERPHEDIEIGLERGELDLGIGFTDARSEEIDAQPLFPEHIALLVATGHPLAKRRQAVTLAQLQDIPMALLSKDFVVRKFADAYFRANQVSPSVMLQANALGTVLKSVKHGRLATILPSAVLRAHRGLVSLPLDPPLPERTVALLTRQRSTGTLAAKAFSDLLFGMIAKDGLSEG